MGVIMARDVRELTGRLIDAGTQMRIDDVHIADGAIGLGNSAFQCGLDESNPPNATGTISGAIASVTFPNSRLGANAASSNALVAGCTGYQGPFAVGQVYTQPAVSFGTVSVTGNVLYAVPFFSPASGGPVSKLGIDVPGSGPATCDVGVYNAVNGQPTTLIADGGTLSGTGTLVTAGTLSASVQLAPQTLYFLAVGCNGSASLLGALNNTGAPSAALTGGYDYTDTTTQMTAPWTFVANALPTLFGNGTITTAAGSIPNVYAEP